MKERGVRCKAGGERYTVVSYERPPTSAICHLCREERQREQTRERMRALREHSRNG